MDTYFSKIIINNYDDYIYNYNYKNKKNKHLDYNFALDPEEYDPPPRLVQVQAIGRTIQKPKEYSDCSKCKQPLEVGPKSNNCQSCVQIAKTAILMMYVQKEKVYFTLLPRDVLLMIIDQL